MMMKDWKTEIAIACRVQDETAKLDQESLWDYYLPTVAAKDADLTRAETAIGHKLDQGYREFLLFADGWRCFYQQVDLFGTKELCGEGLMHTALLHLNAIEPEEFEKSGFRQVELLPIAASPIERDIFVMARPLSTKAGVVIWLAGYEVEQFPTFDEFFLAMVDYNRLRLKRFQAGAQPY